MSKEWSPDEIERSLASVEAIANKISPAIHNILKHELGVKFTPKQWDIMVGDTIISTLHIAFVARHSASDHNVDDSETFKLRIGYDKCDYDKVIESSEFWIEFQRVINFLKVKSRMPLDSLGLEIDFLHSRAGSRDHVRNFIYRLINKCSGMKKDEIGLVVGQYWKCNLVDEFVNVWKLRKYCWFDTIALEKTDFNELSCVDVGRRLRIANNCLKEQTIEGFYKAVFFLMVPVLMLESFETLRRTGDVFQSKNKAPRFIYTANAVRSNLLFKYLASIYREKKVPLVVHQHGGSYGLDKDFVFEKYEKRIADRFYTFGWKKRSDHNCKVLPIGTFDVKRGPKNIECLIVSGVYPKVINRLHYQPMGRNVVSMFYNLVEVVSRLDLGKKIVIRSRKEDYGWGLSEFYRRRTNGVVVDDQTSIASLYGRSKLVVHCYICTSFLETIAHGIPTVGIVPQGLVFDGEAQRCIDALRRCGVLHDDPLEVAEFVSKLLSSNSTASWWNSAETVLARADFCSNYALMLTNWLEYWQHEFRNLISAD